MYEKVAIITQIWQRAKHYFTSIISTWFIMTVHPMVHDHGTKNEDNPFGHRGGMCEDEQIDGRTDGLTEWASSYIP